MKKYIDTKKEEERIQACMKRYGNCAEHNYWWYEYSKGQGENNVFVEWPDGTGLCTREKNDTRTIFVEPLASKEKMAARISEYAASVIHTERAKKVIVELKEETRKALVRELPKNLRASAINYTLISPVMDMSAFDSTLPGGRLKHIRQADRKLRREHRVEVQDARSEEREKLRAIVERWKEKRGGKDKALVYKYHNLIDGNFHGITSARVLSIDGAPHGCNAGWNIPNSTWYYGAIGIHDYAHPDLGLILYLEDLVWVKNNGYPYMDTGGGEKALTKFKEQFNPSFSYKTFIFSIVKQK